MNDAKHPVVGDVVIDASDLKLIRTTTEKTKKFSRVRGGHDTAVNCVLNLSPAILARAGISAGMVAELGTAAEDYDGAAAFVPAVKRLAELVKASAQGHGDRMANALSNIARLVSSRARHDENGTELLAAAKDLLDYVGAPSKKAVDTKRKTGVLKPKAVKQPKARKGAKASGTDEAKAAEDLPR